MRDLLQSHRASWGRVEATCHPASHQAEFAALVLYVQQISTFATSQVELVGVRRPASWGLSVEQKLEINSFGSNLENTHALGINERRERCSAPSKEGAERLCWGSRAPSPAGHSPARRKNAGAAGRGDLLPPQRLSLRQHCHLVLTGTHSPMAPLSSSPASHLHPRRLCQDEPHLSQVIS